jgi:hypothetical protein
MILNMEGVYQQGNHKVPEVSFNPDTAVFEIKGSSIPENSGAIYEPIIDFLQEYKDVAKDTTTFNLALSYFNTSSSKWILNILRLMKEIKTKMKKEVVINWYYEPEDEEMLEAANDYESILNLDINKIEQKFD